MTTTVYNPAEIDFERPGKYHYHVAFHLDSSWGFSLVPLTVINGLRNPGEGRRLPGVAVFGGTHGNEWEGQVAVKHLSRDLDPAEMDGRVILIPQLSESACTANQRVSPLDGVNMNRAFPGDARGTVSYRIAHFVKTSIFTRVGVVLDIHSGGHEAIFPLCTSFHPIADPTQRAEMAEVACLFDTPFVFIYSNQMASGLLTSEAEAEGKIVLRHYRMLPGERIRIDPERTARPRFIKAEDLADYIPCPRDGIWEPLTEPGAEVGQGELLGRLHDFSDFTSEPVEMRAHRSGILAAMHFAAVAKKGSTLYVIAQEAEL